MAIDFASSMTGLMKTKYIADKELKNLVGDKNPLLKMLKTDTNSVGDYVKIPVITANVSNVSALPAVSFAAPSAGLTKAFNVTRIALFQAASVTGETLAATANSEGAYQEAGKFAMDTSLKELGRVISIFLYREGWGDIGVIATGGITGATITLTNQSDALNFMIGMRVQFAATQASSALRGTDGFLTVSGVDYENKIVTFSSNVSTISGGNGSVAVGDYVFIRGCRQDSASPARVVPAGLGAWTPATKPDSTLFFNVDRSTDFRLYGRIINGTSSGLQENLMDGAVQVSIQGGELDSYFMSPRRWNELSKSMLTQLRYDTQDLGNGKFGFAAIVLTTPAGEVRCYADRQCPDDRVFGLCLDAWKLYSAGPTFKVLDRDGNTWLRDASADSYTVRFGGYFNLATTAPNWAVRINLVD